MCAFEVMMRHNRKVQSRNLVRGLQYTEAMACDDIAYVHWFYFNLSWWVTETKIFLEM